MRRDMAVPDDAPGRLPRIEAGTALACADRVEEGYIVLCRDLTGSPRLTLLPFRDAWGHLTAVSSDTDPCQPGGTLTLASAVTVRPGAVVLRQGCAYPVVATNEGVYRVRYVFGDFDRTLAVPQSCADWRPVGKGAAVQTPQAKLESAIAKGEVLQRELRASLRENESRRENIQALFQQLLMMETENAQLAAEAARAERAYKELSSWSPGFASERETLKKLLRETMAEQAHLLASMKEAELDVEPLRLMHAQFRTAQRDLDEAASQEAGARGRVKGVAEGLTDEAIKADYRAIEDLLKLAVQEHAEQSRALSKIETGKQALTGLADLLTEVRAENSRLGEQIATLTKEMESLRKAIDQTKPAASP